MSGIFRKVMCSDRLPKVEKSYLTNAGWVSTHITESCIKWKIIENPTWWLEEIELPSEGEIEKIANDSGAYRVEAGWFIEGFKKAIELIKVGAK